VTFEAARDAWRRWWFLESSGLSLAVSRIVVVAAQLVVFMPFFEPSLAEHLALVRHAGRMTEPQWFLWPVAAILKGDSLVAFLRVTYFLTIGAGLATLVGWRTRFSAALFALGTWILVAHRYSYGEAHHTEIVVAFFLAFLALSPSGRRLSLDARLGHGDAGAPGTIDTAVWPLRLTQILLAWTYFSNAVAKLAYSGLDWVNGTTLQQHLLNSALVWDCPLGLWLAQRHDLCVALSIATIVLELVFVLAVFVPWTRVPILTAATAFHVVSYVAMYVAFLTHVALFVVFFDFDRLAVWRPSAESVRRSPEPMKTSTRSART